MRELNSSSRGERIRKREQYQKSNETCIRIPKRKGSKNPRTQHIKEGTEIERGLGRFNKQKQKEVKEKLEDQIRKWSQGETKTDKTTVNAKKVLSRGGKVTTELIRKVIRDGMETEKNKYSRGSAQAQRVYNIRCNVGPIYGRRYRQNKDNFPWKRSVQWISEDS